MLAKYGTDGTVIWQRLLENSSTWSFTGAFFETGGSNLAVKDGYIAVSGGYGDFDNGLISASVAQVSAEGTVFSVGNWDFVASNFSGTFFDDASDLTVVDAGKTDSDLSGDIAVTEGVEFPDYGNFLIGTLYRASGGNERLVNGDNQLVLETDGTVTLPQGGTITEGIVTSNPTIQLTPATPDVASQKLVIKGGTQYNSTANGINLGINNNTFDVGDTVEIYVYANDYADQTLYWWIVPEEGGIADPGSGSITLDGNFGTITFTVDSDDYEFRVRVSPEENNYDPDSIGVQTVLLNGDAPTFDSEHHLHLTTGDLEETSIFLGTDNHNVRTTTDGKIQITTPGEGNNVWEFSTTGSLTFPDATVQTTAYIPGDIRNEGDINIDINLTDSTLRRWTFGEDGNLTLPAGGNILDSTGTSVLGSSTSGGITITNSAATFTFGEDFTQTIIGGYGNGTGYIRVEDVNFGDPISTRMYEFLSTLTAGTELTVYTVVDSTAYNAVISFTEFAGGSPASTSRNDIYYTQVSGDELPFSYSATELTLTGLSNNGITFADGTTQTTAWNGDSFLKDIPQVIPTPEGEAYLLQDSDRGRHILINGSNIFSIVVPLDATAPMPVGSAIVLVLQPGAYGIGIEPEDAYDALTIHGAGVGTNLVYSIQAGTGGAMATLLKIGANEWMVSGTGLSEAEGP